VPQALAVGRERAGDLDRAERALVELDGVGGAADREAGVRLW